MDPNCEAVLRELATDGGLWALPEEYREHLETCRDCAGDLEVWRRIHGELESAVAASAPELSRVVLDRLPRGRGTWGMLLPVAASLAVASSGVFLLGGTPGADLLGILPVAGIQAGRAALAGWGDLWLATVTAIRAVAVLIVPAAAAGAGMVAVLGGLVTAWRLRVARECLR